MQKTEKSISYPVNGKVRPAEYLLSAIAEHEDREVNELPPIHKYVDPEALNDLFDPSQPYNTGLKTGNLSFVYSKYHITFHSEGTIEIKER